MLFHYLLYLHVHIMCFEESLNYLHFAAVSDFILVPNIDYVPVHLWFTQASYSLK